MTILPATHILASRLARGGNIRLDTLDDLALLIRTDCGRQVSDMTRTGWDGKDAAQAYREWLIDWAAETIERFIVEDLQP